MKNFILGISVLSLFVACNKDNDSCKQDPSREIKLNASVYTETKSPINSNFSTDFPIGIYAHNGSWLAGTSANVINNDKSTVAGAAGHGVTFAGGPYYYPTNGSDITFFAFAPQGTETTAAGAGTSPVVSIPMTGQEDIMFATATGHKIGSASAVPPVLAFAHKLTQLQFTFVADATTSYPLTNKVVSLKVKAQPNSASMTVETGIIAFSGSADMQVLSSSDQTAGIAITATPGTNALSPIMTKTASGSSAYLLDIVVKPGTGTSNVTYTDIPVNLTSVVGSSHMITLTFAETAITATATVANWANGGSSSVTVL